MERPKDPQAFNELQEIDVSRVVLGACIGIVLANVAAFVANPESYRIAVAAAVTGLGGQVGASLSERAVTVAREVKLGWETLKQRTNSRLASG